MDRPSQQRRQGDRRRLWGRRGADPRRASNERRSRDRRGSAQEAPSERRAGSDRRRDERRELERRTTPIRRRGRRRRETPTPFSTEQFTELKTRFAAPGPVQCPACGSSFTLGPGRRRGAETARRVICLGCGRAAVVPATRASRILLVGQQAGLRDALQAMLVAAGHEVVETDDAAVALLAYQAVPADVIFLDVIAPGRMAPPEFLRRLRRVHPDARVVAMAGRPSYIGGADPVAGLGVRTIRMPVSRKDVLRTIDEARS